MQTPFTLEDIHHAHSGTTKDNVGTYLARLHALGVMTITTHIADGHSDFRDAEGNSLSSSPVHDAYAIAPEPDAAAARAAIEAHGRGETDYFQMSRALAAAGVATWVMDPAAMTLTYRCAADEPLLTDKV